MRRKGVNKEETRRKVLDSASKSFRKHGYAGIGVDYLAKSAGVTSGAIYSHFGSKEGAFDEVLAEGLEEVITNLPQFQQQYGADWVKEFAHYYMTEAHRQDLECGCAMASLTPEVVRFGDEVHGAYERKMQVIVDIAARGLAGAVEQERRARAWSMLSVLIGGITVSRAMRSRQAAREVAAAIAEAAVRAAGKTRVKPLPG